MSDLISIIIPTYNRGYIIKECIENILLQSYSEFEVIIVDDGSVDDTESRVKSYHDSRIIYQYQKHQGACVARNVGIEIARGKFIAFQDSDDLWNINKLQRQIDTISATNADLVFCKMIAKNTQQPVPSHIKEGFVKIKEVALPGISTQTILGKANVFKDIRFDVELPRLQDLEILIRLSKKYSIYCMDQNLVEFRRQMNSISQNVESLISAGELILYKDAEILDDMVLTKAEIMEQIGFSKTYIGINAWTEYKEIYNITKKKKDFIKMIMAYFHVLDKFYKIKYLIQ